MISDPIVEETRRVRDEYAKEFNYDLHALFADLRKREAKHPEKVVSLPPRLVKQKETA